MNFAQAIKNETKWARTENGAVALKTTDDALLDFFGTVGALRTADENRITSIFEEYEALRGRKNIVYGLNIVRRVRNHVLRDENYTKRAWNEYNSLLAMYKYKYGEPIVLYDNKLPEGMELTTKLSRRLHWEDVNSLTNEQRIDMRFLHDYLYSKVVLFSIAGGRIYLGQSYVSDCLNIIYIDNEAQRIADDEYNFVKVI